MITVKNVPSRGLPPRIVIPVVLCIAIIAAIPIISFLKTGFGTSGSSIAPAGIMTPPPAIAEALSELRSRIARNPHDVEALSALAGLYAQIGRTSEAANLEGQAVKSSPNDVALREADATLLRSDGKLKEAVAQLDAVLRLQPHNADALYERATIELQMHDRAPFRRDMQRFLNVAASTDPRRAMAHATLKAQL